MEIYIGYVLKTLILPPGGNFLGLLIGALARHRFPRVGRFLLWVSLVTLFLLSLPAIAGLLAVSIERYAAISPQAVDQLEPATIVVLAGGKDIERTEYGGDTLTSLTLQRIRYGAFLAKRTQLPLAVAGGSVFGEGISEAELMALALKEEFGVDVDIVESNSRNTAENAINIAKQLPNKRIILVTHALHMRRAVIMFERQGLEVVAAPLDSMALQEFPNDLFDWLPAPGALSVSRYVLHEWLGIAWYAVRY